MPRFPEREWMQAVADAVAAHPDAAAQAPKVAGVYHFAVTRSGPLERAYDYRVRISPNGDGQAPEVTLVDGEVDADLGILADYERWKRLLTGHLDVTRSILSRKLKVEGGVGAAMKRIGAVHLIEDAVATIDTTWPDET